MKKIIIICLCIAAIVAIGVGIYEKTKGPSFGISSILPQNVSIYVELHDVEKNFKTLASMPVWEGIRSIDLNRLMEKNALNGQQVMFFNLIKDQLLEVVNNPLAKRLFGHDVAIAVYPLDYDATLLAQEMKVLSPKFIEEILSGLFLVTRVDKDVQFAEFVSRFFKQFGPNVSQGQVEYKGEIIRTIAISDIGVKFGIVRLNDLLVIGVGEKAARVSVDVYKRDKPSLAEDPQFAKSQNRFLKPSSVVGYFNFVEFIKELKNQEDNIMSFVGSAVGDAQRNVQWTKILAKLSGLKAFAFSSQLTPVIRVDSRLIYDADALDAEYAPLYTCPSSKNKTIDFTPQEVLGYHWGNCFKLDYYWAQMVKEVERLGASASKIDEFEATIGLSIEKDILPAFGEEIGGYIQDIQVGGLFPIPKFLFFVEIANRPKAEKLMSKLEELPFVMFQDENYNGTLIKYLALPLGQDIQPGYAFLGDHLLISTSRKLLQDSIDVSHDTSLSLQVHPDFKEIDFGLTDDNRSVQFIRIGQVVEKAKGVIDWSTQWTASRDRKAEAFKAGSSKPLEEVKANIVLKESELEVIRDRLILAEDDVWNLESKGMDASVKQTALNELQNQLDAKKNEIVIENERKEELVSIAEEIDDGSLDPALRQFYLDEIVYPVLDSLKSIKSFGLRSTVYNDAFESSVFLKIAD